MRSRLLRSDHLGPRVSEGTRLLWLVLRRKGWSQNQLAIELGVDSGTVNRWLHGELQPSLDAANVIEKRLEIATSSWSDPPRRQIVLRTGTDS